MLIVTLLQEVCEDMLREGLQAAVSRQHVLFCVVFSLKLCFLK